MTSVSRLPGSTLTTTGADTGLGLLLGDDLFFGDRAEAADLVGLGYLVVDVDGACLLDLSFELLLFGLVLGTAWALVPTFLSTYSRKIHKSCGSLLTGSPFGSNEYMSTTKMTNNPTKPDRVRNALALANCVQRRRQNLGMSIERAADLAGMRLSQWFALETGWVPNTLDVLRAVADTLELGYLQLSFLAEISEFNQTKPV
jgi:hypothetical protein